MKKVTFVLAALLLLIVGVAASGQANASTIPNPDAIPAAPQSKTAVSESEGESIARAYLLANAATYGVTEADLVGMRVTSAPADTDTGTRYVYFQQTANGIGVYNGVLNVTLRSDGSVIFAGSSAVAGVAEAAKTAPAPTLTQSEAIAAAAADLGLTYKASTVTQLESLAGSEREIRYAGGDLSLESIPVKLVYQPTGNGSLRLTWDLNIYPKDAQNWWTVRVDAATGELLSKYDWVVSENFDSQISEARAEAAQYPQAYQPLAGANGPAVAPQYTPVNDGSSYKVYQFPVESPNHTTPLPPADGRGTVNNPAEIAASPFGWHDTNGVAGAEFTTTQGNNVHAYTDTDANNTPDAGSSPDGGAGLDFAPPLDLTLAPSGYRPAAVVNLFYWNNLLHDIPYQHGWTEQFKNFQENNYGEGGLGSDYVQAEAQDGSGTNNANFGTPPDGQNPRMQMYIWTAPNPDRDGDIDNGIIAHEYGHGISNRLVGGGTTTCLGNSEQMGEGWSDWQAIMFTQLASHTATTNRGMGTYALNQPINGVGIRAFPYNTDMTVDPRTYQDTRTAAVPHGVGSIWTAIIWEVNWALRTRDGFNADLYQAWNTGGNNLAYRLIQDGMKGTPCNPGFVDGRNAILAADVALTGGVNRCILWTAFAKRGLGENAVQGSSGSNADNTNGFNIPSDCSGGPTNTPTVSPTPSRTPTASATPDPTYCVNQVVTIPDNNPAGVNSVLNVSTSGTLTDLNVSLNVTHSWVGDVRITLAHGATTAELFDRPGVPTSTNGCSGDDINNSADDGAATSFEAACTNTVPAYPAGGSFIPGDPAGPNLAAFNGQNVNGTWTLNVSDNASIDTGTLNGWCLQPSFGTGPTSTPTATSQASATPSVTATGSVPATATATVSPTPGSGGTYCSTTSVAIPDNNPAGVNSVLNVSDSGAISDLNVSFDVTHSWVGDLIMNLSHGATTAELYDRPGVPTTGAGCSGDNMDVIADDGAATSFEAACTNTTPAFPAGGSFIPGDPAGPNLAAFNGQDVNGTWTLNVSDNAGLDTGTLNEWCLIVGGGGPTPTASPTSSPTPQGNAPDIDVDPASVTETHNTPPQTTNRTLSIDNTGTAPLDWSITEETGAIVLSNQKPYVPSVVGSAPAAQGGNSLSAGTQGGAPYRNTLVPSLGSTTVTHSSSQDIVPLNSVSCNNGVGHTDNSYYRVFDLAGDFGINDTFTVNEVSFGIEQATGATGSQPVSVILYTLSGPFVVANLTEIGQEDITVADTSGTIETVTFDPAVVVPANSTLVVEVFTPDGQAAGNLLFIGSNAEAQTDPSYLRAATCGVTEPTDTAAIGFPDMHIVLNATGDVGGGGGSCTASDIPWLTLSPTSGTTAPGGSSNVTLTFNSTGLNAGTYTGNLCIESNDPDENPVDVPVTLNVGPVTAVTIGSLTQAAGGFRIADFAAAGILVLVGATLLFRRRK